MNNQTTNSALPAQDVRLAVSPAEAARMAGIGRTTLYEALGSGALRSLKIGKRRLITIEALKEWLAAAEWADQQGANDAR
jgi:excisionase family DNA binding protein